MRNRASRRTSGAVAGVLGILALTACGAESGPLEPPGEPQPLDNQIVFVSDRDGNGEIYVMNSDGSGLANLTQSAASDLSPVPSPDGSHIAFFRHVDTVVLLQVMNADGTGLVSTYVRSDGVTWSPNGTRLALTAISSRGTNFSLDVLNLDGSPVTTIAGTICGGNDPSWSPDGTRLAFVIRACVGEGIYVYDVPSGMTTTLVRNADLNDDTTLPAWSPDGTRIAFSLRSQAAERNGIFVVGADGNGLTKLGPQTGVSVLRWSPDGSRLAFVSDFEGNNEVYLVNANGTGLLNLTQDAGDDSHVTWAPNGMRLAFDSDRTNDREIFAVDVDGTNLVNLTNNPAVDEEPFWSSSR